VALTPMIGEGHLRTSGAVAEPPEHRAWADGAIILDHRNWCCVEADLSWRAPMHLIVLTETGRSAETRISCAGETHYAGCDRPCALSFIPAGVDRTAAFRGADLSYTALWLDPRLAPGDGIETLPILLNRADVLIAELLRSTQREIAGGHVPDDLYMEHLGAVVMHRIRMLDGNAPSGGRGGLSKPVLRRIAAFVDENLGGQIRLGDLAAVAGLDPDTFARRFRAATGKAPYAYVVGCRITRAEQLLADARLEIGTVAARLGYSSQSHFTSAFRAQRGMTPRAFRRQITS
jgi:AraC family transcriptional regulator